MLPVIIENPPSEQTDGDPAVVPGRTLWRYYIDECVAAIQLFRSLTSNWSTVGQWRGWTQAATHSARAVGMTVAIVSILWLVYVIVVGALGLFSSGASVDWTNLVRRCDRGMGGTSCGHTERVTGRGGHTTVLMCVYDSQGKHSVYLAQPLVETLEGERANVLEYSRLCPTDAPVTRIRYDRVRVSHYPVVNGGLGGYMRSTFDGPASHCIQHLMDENPDRPCGST